MSMGGTDSCLCDLPLPRWLSSVSLVCVLPYLPYIFTFLHLHFHNFIIVFGGPEDQTHIIEQAK